MLLLHLSVGWPLHAGVVRIAARRLSCLLQSLQRACRSEEQQRIPPQLLGLQPEEQLQVCISELCVKLPVGLRGQAY